MVRGSALTIGVSHSGKTRALGTVPGKGIILNLEPPSNVESLRVPWEETENLQERLKTGEPWEKMLVVQYQGNPPDITLVAKPDLQKGKTTFEQLIKDLNFLKGHKEKFDSVAIESLFPLAMMALDFILVGNLRSKADFTDYRDVASKVLTVLNYALGLQKFFVLTSHVQQETDEATGMAKPLPSAIGRVIPNQIPKLFNEVFRAVSKRKGASVEYVWLTQPDEQFDYLGSRRRDSLEQYIPQDFTALLNIPELNTKKEGR